VAVVETRVEDPLEAAPTAAAVPEDWAPLAVWVTTTAESEFATLDDVSAPAATAVAVAVITATPLLPLESEVVIVRTLPRADEDGFEAGGLEVTVMVNTPPFASVVVDVATTLGD
jgi:hypothetical protein